MVGQLHPGSCCHRCFVCGCSHFIAVAAALCHRRCCLRSCYCYTDAVVVVVAVLAVVVVAVVVGSFVLKCCWCCLFLLDAFLFDFGDIDRAVVAVVIVVVVVVAAVVLQLVSADST